MPVNFPQVLWNVAYKKDQQGRWHTVSNNNTTITMSNTSNAVKIPKRTTTSGWAIYSNDTGALMFFGMSRSAAREFKMNYSGSENITGARRVDATVRISN